MGKEFESILIHQSRNSGLRYFKPIYVNLSLSDIRTILFFTDSFVLVKEDSLLVINCIIRRLKN